jgi:hypothetical protein
MELRSVFIFIIHIKGPVWTSLEKTSRWKNFHPPLQSGTQRRSSKKLGAQEIAGDADLNVLRSRIARRPKDISRLVSELFEVGERAVIYTPRFSVQYKNLKTGEEKTVEFDGVTGERIRESKRETSHNNPPISPPAPSPPP